MMMIRKLTLVLIALLFTSTAVSVAAQQPPTKFEIERAYEHEVGQDVVVFYGVSVTDADIVMSYSKSLENVGVTPDEIKVPTPADMAAKHDPVLAYAAGLLGSTISSEKAGALFPIEWRK